MCASNPYKEKIDFEQWNRFHNCTLLIRCWATVNLVFLASLSKLTANGVKSCACIKGAGARLQLIGGISSLNTYVIRRFQGKRHDWWLDLKAQYLVTVPSEGKLGKAIVNVKSTGVRWRLFCGASTCKVPLTAFLGYCVVAVLPSFSLMGDPDCCSCVSD